MSTEKSKAPILSLGETQRKFSLAVGNLICKAYMRGYEVTLGDAYRDPRLHGPIGVTRGYGHRNSNHKRRLAIDLNLFRDGSYLDMTEDHRELGEWWEAHGEEIGLPLRWGGRFRNPDGNHYSCEWRGQL